MVADVFLFVSFDLNFRSSQDKHYLCSVLNNVCGFKATSQKMFRPGIIISGNHGLKHFLI